MHLHQHSQPLKNYCSAFNVQPLEPQEHAAALQLFDHGHIQTPKHAKLFKTGELCVPGHPPEYVSISFVNFQFNTMQDRMDAVYTVLRNGQNAGEFFASAFRHLWL